MRILLVGSPKIIMGFDRVTRLPNLGLNSIASNINNSRDRVKVLDLVLIQNQPQPYFLNYLKFYSPDIVGFSCMTFQYDGMLRLAKLVREYGESIKIIFGGYHPTIEFEHILEGPDSRYIDFIVRNEGESTFSRLMEQIQQNGNFHDIPSLSFLEDGSPVHNPAGALLDLDQIRIPNRKNRVLKKRFHILGLPADVIETSRGCVNSCRYCSIRQMYGRKFRKYKIERVIRDIKDAAMHGAKAILISDDNITVDAKRFENICRQIIDHKLNDIKYAVQASIPGIKRAPNLPRLMFEAGVDICFIGFENSTADNINFLDTKRIPDSDAAKVVNELQGYGITVIGSFIIGNPGDTRETILENFQYANHLNIDVPLFLILTPFPKTETRKDLLKDNLITNADDFSRYDLFHANIRTHSLSPGDIEKMRDEIAFKIFKKSSRLWKLLKKYPGYSSKLILNQIVNQPGEIFGHIRGIFR
jgi:anaerobic magnesium-protoporphyrin IX monomethyl ester cyclase